ncbi:acyltransferase family protein [Paenibacillus glufosinatiresistens]|uniref:acyltransferase family protein n=1 Tax=Paenibacillus glufosinatiresistens TaxID=3070657 RepID=UPI00286D7754|nr:acyltransferase [Paenibacillus sp. YX.27]
MRRLHQLDSVRGLASLSVLLHHLWLSAPLLPLLFVYSPVRIALGGHQAVLFFFILSGFVLALPFLADQGPSYLSYLLKRVCRIYIPYVISLTVALLLAYRLSGHSPAFNASFFQAFWQSGFAPGLILEHLSLVADFNTYAYNTVFWSLVHEMRISLIFPLLMLAVARRRIGFNLLLCLVLAFLGSLGDLLPLGAGQGYHTSYSDTVYFASFFIIGALAAKHRSLLIALYLGVTTRTRWLAFGAAVLLYGYSKYGADKLGGPAGRLLEDGGTTLAILVFLVMALTSEKTIRVLNGSVLSFLGRISYSLYLYHFILILTLAYALREPLPGPLYALIAVLGSIALAAAAYYTIEIPSIRLGRMVGQRLTRAEGGEAPPLRRAG